MRKSRILGLLLGGLFCIANAAPGVATTDNTDQAPKVIMVKSAGNNDLTKTTHVTTSKTKAHKGTHKHKNTHNKAATKSHHKKTNSTNKKTKSTRNKSKQHKKNKSH